MLFDRGWSISLVIFRGGVGLRCVRVCGDAVFLDFLARFWGKFYFELLLCG